MFFPAKTVAKKQKTLFRDVELRFGVGQTEFYNAEFFDGKLRPLRNSFKKFYGDGKMIGILCVTKDGVVLHTQANGVIFFYFNGAGTIQFKSLQELPVGFACYYGSGMASCSDKFRYTVDCHEDDTVFYIDSKENNKAVSRLVMCGSRLIGVTDDWLLLFPPTHEGDYGKNERIRLPSNCSEIAVINSQTAYLLGDIVYKLTLSDDDSDVKLEKVASNLGETVYNTVSVIDGRAVFISKSGLQQISAGKVKRICRWLDGYVDGYTDVAGTYFDGNYYFSCALNTPSGKKEVTLVIDLATEKVIQTYDKKYEQLIAGDGKLFARDLKYAYRLADSSPNSISIARRNVDFGGQTTLKALLLQHRGQADITIRSDKGAVKLSVYGNGRKKRYRIGKLTGKLFDVEGTFYGDCCLQSLTLEAGGTQ